MTIQLIIFLYIYFAFVAACFVLGIMAIYHLNKFGQKATSTVFVSFIFLLLISLILFITYFYLNEVDWKADVEILKYFFNSDYQLQ